MTEPDFPDPGAVPAPTQYGDFELIPFGARYVHPHAYAQNFTLPVGPVTNTDAIRSSALYRAPASDPGMSIREEALTALGSGAQVLETRASYAFTFDDQHYSAEVVGWKPRLPLDADIPVPGGTVELEYGVIGEDPALFYRLTSSAPCNEIWVIHGAIVTQIDGLVPFDALLKFAEGLQ